MSMCPTPRNHLSGHNGKQFWVIRNQIIVQNGHSRTLGPDTVEGVLTLDDVVLSGRTVLYRVDVNSPLEPSTRRLLDDGRLKAIIPTLDALSSSRVVIMGHQSRPGKSDFTNMQKHCDRLSKLLGKQIRFVPDICEDVAVEAIKSLSDGEMIFLDNVRMNEEEYGTKYDSNKQTEDTSLVSRLSSVSDLLVTDAFAAAHRRSPTPVSYTHLTLPTKRIV